MGKVSLVLTVYFEEPFWVGVFECTYQGKTSATRITFGAEPKDNEVYEFFLKHFTELRFSPAVAAAVSKTVSNPKRMQRKARSTEAIRPLCSFFTLRSCSARSSRSTDGSGRSRRTGIW